jgi:hypothetical protein
LTRIERVFDNTLRENTRQDQSFPARSVRARDRATTATFAVTARVAARCSQQ